MSIEIRKEPNDRGFEKLLTEASNKAKVFAPKSILHILIKKFGLQTINEAFAELFFEEANARADYFFDEVSEMYDNINKLIKMRHLNKSIPKP